MSTKKRGKGRKPPAPTRAFPYKSKHGFRFRGKFVSLVDAAYIQRELLAQLAQTEVKSVKALRALEQAINRVEVTAQIDIGATRSKHYKNPARGELDTWKNQAYVDAGEVPPADETFQLAAQGKAWDGWAWYFIGPDGEDGAHRLLQLFFEKFGATRGIKSWVDIGIGPDTGEGTGEKSGQRHVNPHLSTPLTSISRTQVELHGWKKRPSAQHITSRQEETGEQIWFVVNLTAERGTDGERKAKEVLGGRAGVATRREISAGGAALMGGIRGRVPIRRRKSSGSRQ